VPASVDPSAAVRLIEKVREFVTNTLTDEEAALFAALLAPGVALAYPDNDVEAFGADPRPAALPEALCRALQEGGITVSGFR
jgi:hypothetical protein